MNRDFTVGKPDTLLWRFCLPLFGSIVFQQLYSIADSLIAGNFIGENALAAVGNSYEITLIFLAFAFGCNIGCSVVVSQLFGAKKYGDMKTAVHTAMISSALICLVLMLTGIFGGEWMLRLIHTPDDIMADSLLYLDIYIWGLPFVLFYNISNGVFSALGDSRTPFIFLACSSIANIGADILFVTAFDMGVAGVAWATFLCQGISCVLALFFVFRRLATVRTEERGRAFSLPILAHFASIAIPSILQQSFVSVGNIVIQRVINGFGAAAIAGYAASIKLNSLAITSFSTIGNGISNYTAQNYGAGKQDRLRAGFRAGLRIVCLIAVPLVLLYVLGAPFLVRLFMRAPSQTALDSGVQFLRIVAPFYFSVAIKLVADGILRGVGKMGPFMASTFTDLVLRVILAIFLSRSLGVIGIWLAWPVGWIIATILSVIFYRTGEWFRKVPKTVN